MSKSDTKLVALCAEIGKLKTFNTQAKVNLANLRKRNAPGPTKPDQKKKRIRKGPAKWSKVPPRDGEPKTKMVNSHLYHWCHYHSQWTIHHPSECRKGTGGQEKRK